MLDLSLVVSFVVQIIVIVALPDYRRSFLFDELRCGRSWEMAKAAENGSEK